MEEAKTLLRTAVRTFFSHPKQILLIDALMVHSVLHIDDMAIICSSQAKDIRALINPLKAARLLTTHSRVEVRVGTQRGVTRDYYYSPFHPAIDAIKYRIAKLRKKVNDLYKEDETKRKDWRCPRCKAEYEELEILDKIGDEGFFCDRCGATLVQNKQAVKDKGSHEKILRLNSQLKKFDDILLKIDHKDIPENDFVSAWERKKEVPRERGGREGNQYMELKRDDRNAKRGPEMVKVENLAINLTSGAQADREEQEKKEERKRLLAKQNQLPVWHTQSAIGANGGATVDTIKGDSAADTIKAETAADDDSPMLKREDSVDEKKPLPDVPSPLKQNTTSAITSSSSLAAPNMQDEVAAYMAEMERERQEAERRAEAEDAEEDEEDDDLQFEDVVGTSVAGTPASSSQGLSSSRNGFADPKAINGIKREFEDDDSSEANTPASSFGERGEPNKRVKSENGGPTSGVSFGDATGLGNGGDSDEDEDFEDAL
ncbi:hypothetical protein B0A52_02417 [Exophiala mesophila]|uniref:HTH TFE/IIEalpha-type domain-containing protein n=1 Tax=Exophiala mesophila TaxID=212818 RepID=A0A438ND32_EXOME|nr:hypothetical protein B0A52_02417 [Exophiala mesophila]